MSFSRESLLLEPSLKKKLLLVEQECQDLLQGKIQNTPSKIARDIHTFSHCSNSKKVGLSSAQGQAKLLHDLANIELQAMELGIRTLSDFPEAPMTFKEQLVQIVIEEASHLQLCLEEIQNLGYQWGDWPVHTLLWDSTSTEDSFLDRILIVHRYLEGSGLDSSEELLKKLSGLKNKRPRDIVKKIADDEVGHVQFGSHWFKLLCQTEGLDPDQQFQEKLSKFKKILPARHAKIKDSIRQQAGFSTAEINYLKSYHNR